MRVIAGTARRIPLAAPKSDHTRPTTDRIKETLFNMLRDDIPECLFLDLFAGSGGIGIEALSRGANKAVFVETDKAAYDCIRANLSKTRLNDRAYVMRSDVAAALGRLEESFGSFDVIFADPPYRKGWEKRLSDMLAGSRLCDENTLIIVESALDTPTDWIDESCYEVERIKDYKTNRHIFLRKK